MSEWFKKGSAGLEEAKRIAEERASQYGPFRFWLKAGARAKVTFLDSEGFYFSEHELRINNKWGNFYTCRGDHSECPLCDAGQRSSYGCAYTIIDHSEYEGKNGLIKNQKKLLVVRTGVMTKLARRRENLDGNLTHAVFQFARDSKDEARTGEDIDYIKRLTPEEILRFKPQASKDSDEEWLRPFNYMELFAPKSVEELRKLAGQAAPVGSDDFASGAGAVIPPGSLSVNEADINSLL